MSSSEIRRKRPAVSCTLCRRRKIRCDRETPCSNCIRSKNVACLYERDARMPSSRAHTGRPSVPAQATAIAVDGTTTSYQAASSYATPSSTTSSTSSHPTFELQAMKARIAELEEKLSHSGSVAASVASVSPSSPAATHAVQTVTSLAGVIEVLEDNRSFGRAHTISRSIAHKNRLFGQSHWMNGFVVFRDLIEILEPALRMRTSSFLASMNKSKVLARVIKKQRTPEWPTVPTKDLPSKPLCDQLLAGYLRTMESVYRVLHIPSFQKDYEDLWQNPTGSSTSFMMLLKLVLTIGATIHDDKFSLRVEATRWVYEAQTWLSSPDFKSRLGVQYLQIGILLLLARQFINVGSELVWITAGSLFRTAVYIGLHRDPSQLPKMTTFQAEMRRRLWNTILEMSLQTSLESGGPCFFSLTDFNTAPPGNFDDEQLATANAIAMPNHVFTQTSVAIMFRETLPARLAVAKFLNDMGSTGTYEETLRLDTELRAAYKTFRRALQTFQGLSAPLAPRFDTQAVDFIIQRYICCLHVPFFGASLKDPVFAFSRKAVIESSTKIWALAHPVPTSSISNSTFEMSRSEDDSMAQTDLARLCVCGGGFFRTFAFHSSTFLGVELRALVQEEEEDMSSITRPTSLLSTIQDAANWYLHCIEAGETGIKGYLLLQLLATQIDATAKRVEQAELQGLLLQAGEEAMNTCLNILETIAGQESGTNESGENQDFGLQNNLDFMEDWDLMMSDVFDIGDVTLIDNFLT